jgi:hypothetical protein
MKKIAFLLFTFGILIFPLLKFAHSGDIELQVKDFECVEDDKIIVHYSFVSSYDFEYPNVTIGFKLMENNKPIVCKQLKVTVPKNADGSELNEFVINAPCSGKKYNLDSAIFYYVKNYKIEEWFSDCK